MIQDVIWFDFQSFLLFVPPNKGYHQLKQPPPDLFPYEPLERVYDPSRAYGQVFVPIWRFVGFTSSLLWVRVLKWNDFGLE